MSSAIRPVDAGALADYLKTRIDGFQGAVEIEKFAGGQSNPTYRLKTRSRVFAMRTKPGPKVSLLPSAHAIEREFRVQSALAHSDVPVAKMYHLCEDEEVIGRSFYVMEYVEGRIFWDQTLPEAGTGERAAIYDEMNRVVANLHSLNYQALGLDDFGRPGNFFERQIGRWTKQYRASERGTITAMERLIEWLPANAPQSDQTCIVHGDYRIDNIVFHPTKPEALAVLDWELSTLGHPLIDFGYHMMSWRNPPDGLLGLAEADLPGLGIPTEPAYLARYLERTGFSVDDHWRFYLAFGYFRLAAILQGIAHRVEQGTASSPKAKERGKLPPRVAELGWRVACDESGRGAA
ncbi:phosphotransferase family protein [Bradyrhizobium sp. CCBAU 53351]|uniref:phosphotransferase family protein n=1 Tax=Bradyrhizobium sp. CCBAU 53351 TaxID=1325114 RepID=UPI001887B8A3|nr:phosphotransferase family protein [Bradyrhizobium sp. CCBAU 53351]QOZ77706.1 phosphotransferase family protein [Bradyrhizobium sp. CCBAU 53351]